jgi:subtilisin family serine protease
MTKRESRDFNKIQRFRNWGIEKMGLDSIINQGYQGEGVKVCICDTGKPSHPELIGRVAAWKNFTIDERADDGNGHSTHVAGIVSEIAPRARLYFAKVLSDSGFGSDRGILEGMRWCKMQGVDIVNMSLGGKVPSKELKIGIEELLKDTILVVAAVGNDGDGGIVDNVGYPAKFNDVVAVGSLNENGEVSWFSSAGEGGDFVAPGHKIVSLWLGGKYMALSGTSMATPFVAGASALIKEKFGKGRLKEELMERTSFDIEPVGYDRVSFHGRNCR